MITALIVAASALMLIPRTRLADHCPELMDTKVTDPSPRSAVDVTKNMVARVGRRLGVKGRRKAQPHQLLHAAAVLDLVAACLKAGLTTPTAIEAGSMYAPEHLKEPLRIAASRVALGAPSPWQPLGDVEELADIVDIARRSGETGTAMTHGIEQLAQQHRHAAGDAAEAVAEKAGVLIAGPLALCFLPAFVAIGLIPTVAGLAQTMFAGIMPGGGG